jgi:hypothetical protein
MQKRRRDLIAKSLPKLKVTITWAAATETSTMAAFPWPPLLPDTEWTSTPLPEKSLSFWV